MIFVGTSGWQHDSWRGSFYPKELPTRGWLASYAARFPIVEVNNTFYRLPSKETFDRWRDQTPGGFRFVLKASRLITHLRRLKEAAAPIELFGSRAARLGPKLGPLLFQLPPRFAADPARLAGFLAALPKDTRAAFEFRDDSWRTDEVLALLDRAGAAWVMADRPGAHVPTVVTGGWSYIRFHQGRSDRPGYSRAKLRYWAKRIGELPAPDTFVFFNNDERAAAPFDASALSGILQSEGLPVAAPDPGPAAGS